MIDMLNYANDLATIYWGLDVNKNARNNLGQGRKSKNFLFKWRQFGSDQGLTDTELSIIAGKKTKGLAGWINKGKINNEILEKLQQHCDIDVSQYIVSSYRDLI